MTELDRVKEKVAYLKFWQGVVVVADMSLVGWLVSSAESAAVAYVVLGVITVASLTCGILVLHRQIERHIDRIGKL